MVILFPTREQRDLEQRLEELNYSLPKLELLLAVVAHCRARNKNDPLFCARALEDEVYERVKAALDGYQAERDEVAHVLGWLDEVPSEAD